MGQNKVPLGQTDLKSDICKAKATTLPSQRLAAAKPRSTSRPNYPLRRRQATAELRARFDLEYRRLGNEAQNAARESGLRVAGSWGSGMGRSGPAANYMAPCYGDGRRPRHERARR